jgi:hypothetical protein
MKCIKESSIGGGKSNSHDLPHSLRENLRRKISQYRFGTIKKKITSF